MVNGLNIFRQHFASYNDQYVLIGGMACSVIMHEVGLDFRTTKDLDIVLHVEALHENFVNAFWKFVNEGGYKNRQQNTSKEIFYRFSSPTNPDYPAMLELFSRIPDHVKLFGQGHLTPIPVDEGIASLSAILLDEDYYHFIHSGKQSIDGLSILGASHLIPIKARAHTDLTNRKKNGERIDDRDIRKHRNDIIRLIRLLSANQRIQLPSSIQKDFQNFLYEMKIGSPINCNDLGLKNINTHKVIAILEEVYLSV